MIKKNSILNLFIFFSVLLLSSCIDNIDPEILKDLDEETMKDVDINIALKKLTKDMNFGEALVSGYYYQQKKDTDMMIKCYERAITVGGKPSLMKRVTMELANAYILQKDYEKSKKHANTYVTLYPGDVNAKTAAFIEIQASYLSTNTSDRDQKATTETIKLIDAFKENYGVHGDECNTPLLDINDEHSTKIEEILALCHQKMFDSELNVAETYVKQYKHFKNFSALNAAQKRIKYIKDEIIPKIGIDSLRLNDLEVYVDKNMRFELSKLVIQEMPINEKKIEEEIAA